MARHLVPATLEHFNAFVGDITFSGQLQRDSAFDRERFIRLHTRNGEIRYNDAYKTTVSDLGRLPMYAMINGIHHPKWLTKRTIGDRNVGSSLFTILMRNSNTGIGVKGEHLYSVLNEARNYTGVHRALLALPFVQNPAATNLNAEDTVSFMEESLDNIGQLPEHFYTLCQKTGNKGTYNELHNKIGYLHGGGRFENFTFKKGVISVCYGALVDFKKGKVLAMLTLNKDFSEYFLLHKYSQSTAKLHAEIFNVVVDEEFAVNSGEHYAKELWKMVKRGMCNALPSEITTEVIDGTEFFNELYGNVLARPEPTLGPLEQIEQNAEMQEDYILSTVTADTLRARNIVITE